MHEMNKKCDNFETTADIKDEYGTLIPFEHCKISGDNENCKKCRYF